jgi:D-alanyl-D-alanine carboxypeptidase/D-alanyl-D-alanine-endopeptidase (penicillin-binding protein 4)
VSARSVAALRHDLDDILANPSLERGYWAVLVETANSGETLYARNARKLLMPASNMKTLTLAAAAERLGWNFTYETRLVADGPIDANTLDGDLVVVGSGDPSLGELDAAAVFDEWAADLRRAGVGRIAGGIVGDDRAFDRDGLGMGWSWDDLQDGYAAPVSALQYNENAVRLRIEPGAATGDAAVVSVAPEGSGLEIRNLITTSPPSMAAHPLEIRRLPGSETLELRGTVPLGSEARSATVSVDRPTAFFVNVLRSALVARGIEVDGPAVAIDAAAAHSGTGPVLVDYRSAPLSILALRMMKASQNLYAETLVKTLAAQTSRPGTAADGRKAVADVLQSWGIAADGTVLRDGSGLSRYDFVTADALVAILRHVDRDTVLRDPFEASLPVAGRDGTLAGRMKNTRAEGNARAKTGSMANVRSLAGLVTDADGETLAFAILANNFDSPPSVVNAAADAIVVRLAAFRR